MGERLPDAFALRVKGRPANTFVVPGRARGMVRARGRARLAVARDNGHPARGASGSARLRPKPRLSSDAVQITHRAACGGVCAARRVRAPRSGYELRPRSECYRARQCRECTDRGSTGKQQKQTHTFTAKAPAIPARPRGERLRPALLTRVRVTVDGTGPRRRVRPDRSGGFSPADGRDSGGTEAARGSSGVVGRSAASMVSDQLAPGGVDRPATCRRGPAGL